MIRTVYAPQLRLEWEWEGIFNRLWLWKVKNMEVKQIGNIYGFDGGNYAGNVYDKNGLCPAIRANSGGNTQPMIIMSKPAGGGTANLHQNEKGKSSIRAREKVIKQIIVASRGRNPDNPSDRRTGSPTEQRLEPNSEGICNTLTSVQKDNYVLEIRSGKDADGRMDITESQK